MRPMLSNPTAFLLVAGLTTFLPSTMITFVSATTAIRSKVLIHSPTTLIKTDGYTHTLARFGQELNLAGYVLPVYYYDDSLCPNATAASSTLDPNKLYPKHDWNATNVTLVPPFLLTARKSDACPFVQQARAAQHHGATVLTLLDNRCVCTDTDCLPTENCQDSDPVVHNDGSGADISIPVVLLRKEAGDDIHDHMVTKGHVVWMEVRLDYIDFPTTSYQVWTTPTDSLSRYFLYSWEPVHKALAAHTSFHPHPYLWDGHFYLRCGSGGDSHACSQLCTNGGRYCLPSDYSKNISGHDVVVETLRRICVWEKSAEHYWPYIQKMQHACYHNRDEQHHVDGAVTKFTDKTCIDKALKDAGIHPPVIEECMKESGGTETTEVNSKLALAIQVMRENGIVRFPAAVVDGRAMEMTATPIDLFNVLCETLSFNVTPAICYTCGSCSSALDRCIELGSCDKARQAKHQEEDRERKEAERNASGHKKKRSGFWVFLKWVFWLSVLGGALYAVYFFALEREWIPPNVFGRDRRGGPGAAVLTEYMQLSGHD